MARASFSLPTLARCERPRGASLRASSFQPGRLAQGPEEKLGFAGRVAGAASLVIYFLSSQIARSSVGRSGPLLELSEEPAWRKAKSGEDENKRRDLRSRLNHRWLACVYQIAKRSPTRISCVEKPSSLA